MSHFTKIGLSQNIIKVLDELAYVEPTEIQQKVIPQILTSSTDLKAFAQTGTGKTAAFSLPILDQIDIKLKKPQAIILSPTRELALQITKNIENFSKYLKGLSSLCIYGGSNISNQIRTLKKGVHIIVGTPGRTADLLKRKNLDLQNIKWLVLDEADEMLNMGFKKDIDKILSQTPKSKQTLLFSATFPKEVESIAKQYMQKPIEINAGRKNIGAATVSHQFYVVSERNRYSTLKRIIDININLYAIIFCRTRRETQEIIVHLIQDGYFADCLHGDLSQAQREIVMAKFHQKKIQILIATDVAARGLDVNDLTHVINHKLPDQLDYYTHRSGRTGRAGNKGISISIITAKERRKINQLEREVGKKFSEQKVPTGTEICNLKLMQFVKKIQSLKIDGEEFDNQIEASAFELQKLTKDELIKRFLYHKFESLLGYYKVSGDILTDKSYVNNAKIQRFFINAGKMDGLNSTKLIRLIKEKLDQKIDIGQIELLKNFSFFEADATYTNQIVKAFENSEYKGRQVSVEKTEKRKQNRKPNKFGQNKRKKQFSYSNKKVNKPRCR